MLKLHFTFSDIQIYWTKSDLQGNVLPLSMKLDSNVSSSEDQDTTVFKFNCMRCHKMT